MQQKSSEPSHYPKDEIDLRELFSLLFASKRLIFIVTLLFTIATSVYIFSLKPTYKVTTLISNAQYEESRINCVKQFCFEIQPSRIPSGPRTTLLNQLKIAFSDRFQNMSESEALITDINLIGNNNIEIKTEAISKEIATRQASELFTYYQNEAEKTLNMVKNQRLEELNYINIKLKRLNKGFEIQNYNIDNIDQRIKIVEAKDEIRIFRKTNTLRKYNSELRKPQLRAYYDSNLLLNDISFWLIRNLPNVPDEQIDEVQNLEDAFALINKHITVIGLDKDYRDSLINSLEDSRIAYIEVNKYDDSVIIPIEFDLIKNSSAPTSSLPTSDIAVELTDNILEHNLTSLTQTNTMLLLNSEKTNELNKLNYEEELSTNYTRLKKQKLDLEFLLLDTNYYSSEIINQSVSYNSTTKYPKPLMIIFSFLLGLLSASFFILSKSALINYLNSNKK